MSHYTLGLAVTLVMALGAGASALADDSTVAMRSGAVRSVWPRGQSYDGLLDHANQAVWARTVCLMVHSAKTTFRR